MRPLLAAAQATVLACDDSTLESITGYNFHRGCLALVHRPPDLAPTALHGARRLLGIENIANPDNIGGLFRTAAAFARRRRRAQHRERGSAVPEGRAHVDGGVAPRALRAGRARGCRRSPSSASAASGSWR